MCQSVSNTATYDRWVIVARCQVLEGRVTFAIVSAAGSVRAVQRTIHAADVHGVLMQQHINEHKVIESIADMRGASLTGAQAIFRQPGSAHHLELKTMLQKDIRPQMPDNAEHSEEQIFEFWKSMAREGAHIVAQAHGAR
jgi:uncharacterized protein Usg